jgi:hypothetical protein
MGRTCEISKTEAGVAKHLQQRKYKPESFTIRLPRCGYKEDLGSDLPVGRNLQVNFLSVSQQILERGIAQQ